jgi:23S rRNA (adenine2503-C2)-methyltransferase
MRAAVSKTSLHDLTFPELEDTLGADGVNRTHARALWRALYRGGVRPRLDCNDFFPPPLQRWLRSHTGGAGRFSMEPLRLSSKVESSDGQSRKYLLELGDGHRIETVLMGYPGRFTACISTQAGCAMGCVFCATGQMGFARHLRPGEMVAQVLHGRGMLCADGESGLRNLVLMGMGEPLHNYEAVMTALEIISDTRGLNIGPGRITISTVGVAPGILRLAEERRPYHLAVSLHAASDAGRSKLVPAARRWPLAELMEACRFYGEHTGRKIFFEWTLIAGVNDSPVEAKHLAALLAGIRSHVNLIPLNPTGGFFGTASDKSAAFEFQRVLKNAGIPSTVRQRRGIDVAAGCGQLRADGMNSDPKKLMLKLKNQ